MNKSAVFFQTIADPANSLNSFTDFLKTIGATNNTSTSYSSIFQLLSKQPSWGNKTAALFTKAVYHTHIGYAKELNFWSDAPLQLLNDDKIYLPVDAVILHIFENLGNPCKNNFLEINKYIKDKLPDTDFEVWDDLWFWGFITQKVHENKRILEFNRAKYWNIHHAPKDKDTIAKTEILANQFIHLLKN
jgi:hypothetical protein